MFGVIVAGRLVQTDVQQVSETQFLFNIEHAENINHLVVFMTGATPFPDGLGGSVYFSWPSSSGPSWSLLGFLSNDKPSAVFKVSGLPKDAPKNVSPFGGFGDTSLNSTVAAQVGISVEPMAQLVQQTPAANTSGSSKGTFYEFATKMSENLYSYMQSFAISQSQMVPQPGEMFVPASKITNWYETFKRRLDQNQYFWRS